MSLTERLIPFESVIKRLSNSRLEIKNENAPWVEMEKFLSFLSVDVERQTDHLGACTGWTQYEGDNNLIISGGVWENVEYVDNIQYGKKLQNPYNNYVNPFYLDDILTDEGLRFFLNYYSNDIEQILERDLQEKHELESKIDVLASRIYQIKDFKGLLK